MQPNRTVDLEITAGHVANEPKVSFRNGQFIVTDGQHTIEGRILRNGGKDLPILCKVYTGMTVEQEALLFAEQNGFSAPLTAGIRQAVDQIKSLVLWSKPNEASL